MKGFATNVHFDDCKFIREYNDLGGLEEAYLVLPDGSIDRMKVRSSNMVELRGSTIDLYVDSATLTKCLRMAMKNQPKDNKDYMTYDQGYYDGHKKASEEFKAAYESQLRLQYEMGFKAGVAKAAKAVNNVPFDPNDRRLTADSGHPRYKA